jgi:hypothetical protein
MEFENCKHCKSCNHKLVRVKVLLCSYILEARITGFLD